MQGIYKFTNRINKKVYIEKADNLEERFKSHKRNYKKRQKQWILNGTCIDYPRLEEY